MAASRVGARRINPITLVLAGVLAVGFIIFLISGTDDRAASLASVKVRAHKSKDAATNSLSPPSLPFLKSQLKAGEVAPPPPVVHYRMNNVTTSPDPIKNRETVLILTPLVRFYQEYWENLVRISYPHELISLGFIIPRGREGNLATAKLQEQIAKTQKDGNKRRFSSITILRQENEPPLAGQTEAERHAMPAQKARRAAMSRARNSLLFTTLGPTTSWVLWLDSDIVETPPTLIEDLAAFDKPILVPNCYQRYYNEEKKQWAVRAYDFNSWVDSTTAQEIASKMGPDDIVLEGYGEMATYRPLMAYMAEIPHGNPKTIVQLDGVGGTALLVKAEVHRDGAMFPPFAFYHLIETEGFAKMAKRLGWTSWGLPNYFVYHYNE